MLNSVDETFTGRSASEKRAVPKPPAFRCEFEGELLAVLPDDVTAKASCRDKGRMPHWLTGALQELTGAKCCWNKEPFQEIKLLRCEGVGTAERRSIRPRNWPRL